MFYYLSIIYILWHLTDSNIYYILHILYIIIYNSNVKKMTYSPQLTSLGEKCWISFVTGIHLDDNV